MRVLTLPLTLNPIALAALLALGADASLAQPTATQLPVPKAGGALINAKVSNPSVASMTVTQNASATNRALVEWQSFSIGSSAKVNFAQPNAQSVIVNRVVGNGQGAISSSEIYGAMSANGKVFLINPSGVVFGGSAQVNVGSLVATSLDLSDAMTRQGYAGLINGGEVQLAGTAGGGGISVLAADDAKRPQIQVGEGGTIMLVSRGQLSQNGSLSAPGGQIHLASATSARLLPVGTSGYVELLAATPSTSGVELGSGSITDVSSAGTGGQVNIQGHDIALRQGSQVSADGRSGGGHIEVGNDDTHSIVVEQGSTLSADATGAGHGGSVRLRAMYNNHANNAQARTDYGVAEVYGRISARGGVQGGDGGQIETSGVVVNTRLAAADGTLTRRGVVDASARSAGGHAGTWTLDPYNVTISNATATVNAVQGSFVPNGPGAVVNAGDLSAALDGGTSVEITTGTAQAGAEAGNITLDADTAVQRSSGTGTASLTLRAHNDIDLQRGSSISGSNAAPLDIRLYSNLDGVGSGSVNLAGSLLTGGGNVDIGGGLTPATGYALSNGQTSGVTLTNALIDTRGAAGAGNVAMRGEAPSGSFPNGVSVTESTIVANNITLAGRSSQGAAVSIGGPFGSPSTLTTASGLITLQGFADGTVGTGGNSVGVFMSGLDVNLGAGSLMVAGRAVNRSASTFGPAGVSYRSTNVIADANSRGTITFAGELVGNVGSGGVAYFNAQGGPLTIGAAIVNGVVTQPTGANVVIGGRAEAGPAIDLGFSAGTTIVTNGTVNLRPLSVDAAGAISEQPATAIHIGTDPNDQFFYVDSTWLAQPQFPTPGITARGGIVIGSSAHSGAIVVEDGALVDDGALSLSLQNQGAGSGGIQIGAGNSLHDLGLRTTGNVTQAGPIAVSGNLVIEGGPQSTITLASAGNSIGTLAFDPPASFTLQTTGPLTIGAASAGGYTPGTGFTPLALTTSVGGVSTLIQSTGAITINQPVTMTGANAKLDIVAPSITLAPGATVTAPAGGSAQLWATTFTGVAPGPNLYGCVYGDAATCSVSGIALPTTGQQVLHPNQPTLTVAANPATGYIDLALPALGYTTTGLQNGDSAATALSGTLGTTPTSASTYAINQGTLSSPAGYNLVFQPSTLQLRPGITREMLQASFQAKMSSDVYGRNLDQPYICTAASVIRGSLADDTQSDPLASEWGKVRNQPQLSGCLNVTDGGQCAAF